jgi:four helix bundle protein
LEPKLRSRNYSDLIAWQKAMDLVHAVYSASQSFPKEEIYGLTTQMRKAVVSVPSNIAEGQGRKSIGDFLRHLAISHGSLRELETHLLISRRLDYLEEDAMRKLMDLAGEVGRLINGLAASLSKRQNP